jgi:hypothetical protein
VPLWHGDSILLTHSLFPLQNFTAEVLHVPFSAACITAKLFVLPAYGPMFPFLPGDHKKIEFQLNKGKIASVG